MSAPTLTEFLLARYAERESLAHAVVQEHAMYGWDEFVSSAGYYGGAAHQFALACNPEQILAECKAKRQRIEWAAKVATYSGDGDAYLFAAGVAEKALLFDALPYADHPDYDATWAP